MYSMARKAVLLLVLLGVVLQLGSVMPAAGRMLADEVAGGRANDAARILVGVDIQFTTDGGVEITEKDPGQFNLDADVSRIVHPVP